MSKINKEHGVIMLATKDKIIEGSLISRNIDSELAIVNCLTIEDDNAKKDEHQNNYLYFTSDDEIKDSDWVFDTKGARDIYQVHSINAGIPLDKNGNGGLFTKKIIATTDPKLNDRYFPSNHNVPKIPQSFIESYAKNPVDKVQLEYEEVKTTESDKEYLVDFHKTKLKLINNEVVVVKPKLHTREEVETLCRSAHQAGIRSTHPTESYSWDEIDNWINENLNVK